MSGAIRKFQQKWDAWRKLFGTLVEKADGLLLCPEGRELSFLTEGGAVTVGLPYPICLFGVPQRTGLQSSSVRLTVFIDGEFGFSEADEGKLVAIASSVAFFRTTSVSAEISLGLLDAYHFDFFSEDPMGSSPHPVFHAQRSIRLNEALERFRKALDVTRRTHSAKFDDISQERKDALFGLKSFRIPTPQLDVLNLGAIVAADQLVGHGDSTRSALFGRMLKGIHGEHGDLHVIQRPVAQNAGVYDMPRRHVCDWYSRQ